MQIPYQSVSWQLRRAIPGATSFSFFSAVRMLTTGMFCIQLHNRIGVIKYADLCTCLQILFPVVNINIVDLSCQQGAS